MKYDTNKTANFRENEKFNYNILNYFQLIFVTKKRTINNKSNNM